MAITLLQKLGAAALTATYANPTTAGSTLIAVLRAQGVLGGLQDTTNGSWTLAASATGNLQQLWFFSGSAGGVTPTVERSSGSNNIQDIVITEWSGITLSAPLNAANSGQGTNNPYATASITTTKAACLLIGGVSNSTANNLTNTPGAGWADVGANGGGNAFMSFQIVSALGTFNNNGSLSNAATTWEATVAAFVGAVQPASGGQSGLYLALDASLRNSGLRH